MAYTRKTNVRFVVWGAVLCMVAIAYFPGGAAAILPLLGWKEGPRPKSHMLLRSEATLNAWLTEQQKGKSGREYWPFSLKARQYVTPVRFYAVRSWEIVDAPTDLNLTVRIESSTKGGLPIIKLWEVNLDDDGWKIRSVDEKID